MRIRLAYVQIEHLQQGFKRITFYAYKFLVYYQINGAATQGPQELNHNHI